MSHDNWTIIAFLVVGMASLLSGVVLGIYMSGSTLRRTWRLTFLNDIWPVKERE